MGVSKCFSSWFKIPSEQGVVNVLIDLGHLTVRLHRTEGLSSYPLISFPPVGSWVKTSPTQKCSTAGISACYWWRDGIVQGQMGYTTTAGLVMPCLTCPCCCDGVLTLLLYRSRHFLLKYYQTGLRVALQYGIVFTVCTHDRSVWGAARAQQTFSDCIHVYWKCQPTTIALAQVKN